MGHAVSLSTSRAYIHHPHVLLYTVYGVYPMVIASYDALLGTRIANNSAKSKNTAIDIINKVRGIWVVLDMRQISWTAVRQVITRLHSSSKNVQNYNLASQVDCVLPHKTNVEIHTDQWHWLVRSICTSTHVQLWIKAYSAADLHMQLKLEGLQGVRTCTLYMYIYIYT